MSEKGEVPPSPAGSGDALAIIKRLARERFLETNAGTEEDFDELWREAFQVDINSPALGS